MIESIKREEGDVNVEEIERFAFYERAKKAYPFSYFLYSCFMLFDS